MKCADGVVALQLDDIQVVRIADLDPAPFDRDDSTGRYD